MICAKQLFSVLLLIQIICSLSNSTGPERLRKNCQMYLYPCLWLLKYGQIRKYFSQISLDSFQASKPKYSREDISWKHISIMENCLSVMRIRAELWHDVLHEMYILDPLWRNTAMHNVAEKMNPLIQSIVSALLSSALQLAPHKLWKPFLES